MLKKYQWSKLNKQQTGAFTEYFVKMELTMYGFQVYGTEVDDRGIDFVMRHELGDFIQVQVKSLRDYGYLYMEKSKFSLGERVYLAFGFLKDEQPPILYLIPSTVWQQPNALFKDHTYVGKQSNPEWGFNFSKKNMALLEPYSLETSIARLIEKGNFKSRTSSKNPRAQNRPRRRLRPDTPRPDARRNSSAPAHPAAP